MESTSFLNSRGLELTGDLYKSDSTTGVVMSHGFTGDRTEWGYFDRIAEDLNEAGYNVFRFDFSGSGESGDNAITVEKEVDDLDSAIRYLEG